MGIVSVFAVACGIAALIVLVVKMNALQKAQDDPETIFIIKLFVAAALIMIATGILGTINNYFFKIETPFSPPDAELPASASPVPDPEPPEIKPADEADPVKEAKDEHREALDEFEGRAGRVEHGPDTEK